VLICDVHEKFVALVTRHSPAIEKWSILDLGCRTRLVCLEIAEFARLLVRVHLSAKMLRKAHARNLYHRLKRFDLLSMMQSEHASSFDAIIAADIFVYLGKLDEIISEAKRLLCRTGVFAFSIETVEIMSNAVEQVC
jgi:predicted TPR repeat methyltransferase